MTTWPDGTTVGHAGSLLEGRAAGPHIRADLRGANFADNPTFDSKPILQACLNELGALSVGAGVGGGTLILPTGITYISDTLIVPAYVRMIGQGNRSTNIRAMNPAQRPTNPSTFPSNQPLIRLGADAIITFASRIESLTLDCCNITGIKGVYSLRPAEGSAIMHCLIQGFDSYGIHLDQGWTCHMEDLEIFGHSGTPYNTCVFVDNLAGMAGIITNCTVNGWDAAGGIGIHIKDSTWRVSDIHCETCLYGIYFTGNANGKIQDISAESCTNTVRLNTAIRSTIAENIHSSSTSTIIDDSGLTTPLTDSVVSFYSQSPLNIGGLLFGDASTGTPATNNYRPNGIGVILNYQAQPGEPVGWVTTAAGSPDTWRPFGLVYGGSIHTIPYSTSMTPDFSPGGGSPESGQYQKITISNATAMTINAPIAQFATLYTGQELTLDIFNNSGGAHNTINTNSVFKLVGGGTVLWAASTIAAGHRRTITFYFDGTNWIETARSAADIF